jgi:hypothetical protein
VKRFMPEKIVREQRMFFSQPETGYRCSES